MLRLTSTPDATKVTLRAEGELVEKWVDLMEEECHRLTADARPVRLDLSGVTYVDTRGLDRLRVLVDQGVTLVRCPPLIRAMLDGD
jgi:anti-anti-sigma regulatory factor